jgi:hypothetical protein
MAMELLGKIWKSNRDWLIYEGLRQAANPSDEGFVRIT